MVRILGGRGVSAVTGFIMLAIASSGASAAPAVTAESLLNKGAVQTAYANAISIPTAAQVKSAAASAVATVSGAVIQAQPASAVTVRLAPNVATEASWLSKNGWPLYALVDRYRVGAPLDEQAHCIAVAVYHEARGESLEGQLAVARVIMNRAASGKYPASWCETVKQPWQFSFVNPRTGEYPAINESSAAWQKALGVTRLAVSNAVPTLPTDVLWYHADYVSPGWGKRLNVVEKIGTHIFYRA